jgi:hypothetical protein
MPNAYISSYLLALEQETAHRSHRLASRTSKIKHSRWYRGVGTPHAMEFVARTPSPERTASHGDEKRIPDQKPHAIQENE